MEQQREQSEFNNAIGYINRLDRWFFSAAEAKDTNNVYLWIKTLQIIFSELSTKMTLKEKEERKKELFNLTRDVNSILITNKGVNAIPQKLYENLFDYELFLRQVNDDAGLETKKRDNPGSALK